jgi:hypothetical protein
MITTRHNRTVGHASMPESELVYYVSLFLPVRSNLLLLRHQDGSIVRAQMSGSALLRGDDPVAVVVFHDLTEQLWITGKR